MVEAKKLADSIVGLPGVDTENIINLERSPNRASNIAVLHHKCSKPEGYWTCDINDLLLLPATGRVEDAVRAWNDLSLLNANVADHFLNNQEKIPETWQPYAIYFLGTVFVEKPWSEFVYALLWCKSTTSWQLSKQPLQSGLLAGARIAVFK